MLLHSKDYALEKKPELTPLETELLEALELIAGETREDAASWMRGVARAVITKSRGQS